MLAYVATNQVLTFIFNLKLYYFAGANTLEIFENESLVHVYNKHTCDNIRTIRARPYAF